MVREDLAAKKHLRSKPDGRQIAYWWHDFKTKQSTIYIDISVASQFEYDNALQHELCHELMWRIRGDPNWHKE